jgi:hypothetical protein
LLKAIKDVNIEEVQKIINDPNNTSILTRKTSKTKPKGSEPQPVFNITSAYGCGNHSK